MFVLYLLARPVFPTRRRTRVLTTAVFASVVGLLMAIQPSDYEYYRYISQRVAIAVVAVLLPIAGAMMSLLTEWRSGGGRPERPRNRALDIAWSAIVIGFTLVVVYEDLRNFRRVWNLLA